MSGEKIFPYFDSCIFFSKKKNPGIFIFFTILSNNKLSATQILQNCVTSLAGGNSKVKNQDPWKLHEFFMNTPGNSTSFLIDL